MNEFQLHGCFDELCKIAQNAANMGQPGPPKLSEEQDQELSTSKSYVTRPILSPHPPPPQTLPVQKTAQMGLVEEKFMEILAKRPHLLLSRSIAQKKGKERYKRVSEALEHNYPASWAMSGIPVRE